MSPESDLINISSSYRLQYVDYGSICFSFPNLLKLLILNSNCILVPYPIAINNFYDARGRRKSAQFLLKVQPSQRKTGHRHSLHSYR